jgi:WD40 repeat protein
LKSAKKRSVIIEKRYVKLFSEVNVAGYSSFNSDTAFLAGKSTDAKTGVLIIWNTKTGRAQKVLATEKEIIAAAFSPDGKNILYQDLAGKTILADVKTGKKIREYKVQSEPETNSPAL